MMAEMFAKRTGSCKGMGGSMHLSDFGRGMLGALGIVGAGIPIAAGAAYSARVRKSGQVAAAFFGDGATNEGAFHEALNMAGLWKLPVLYICREQPVRPLDDGGASRRPSRTCTRAAPPTACPGVQVDGNDVVAVYTAAREAAERARSRPGTHPARVRHLPHPWPRPV